jgi:hypothetical protein
MIKGIERVAPMLKPSFRDVEIRGTRPSGCSPRLERIDYEIVVDTDESNRRLELLHENAKEYGTVFNTWRQARICRASWLARSDTQITGVSRHAAISTSLFGRGEGRHARRRRLGG